MVLSKPCIHPDCPPRDGFIRGQYESVEFIREVPLKPKKSSSTSDLLNHARLGESNVKLEKAALLRNAQQKLDEGGTGDQMLAAMDLDGHTSLAKGILVEEGRKRGKTISFAGSRGFQAKGEAMDTPREDFDDPAEQNPVEWIMITRSDPGGSVPRFMVERGTPAGIVSDASKFLDWACKKEHPVREDYGEKFYEVDQEIERKNSKAEALEAFQTNGRLAGLEVVQESAESSMTLTDETATNREIGPTPPEQQEGVISALTNAAYASLESYAPQAVINHLPGHQKQGTSSTWLSNNPELTDPSASKGDVGADSVASTSDAASFASAEDHFDDTCSVKSSNSKISTLSSGPASPNAKRHEKELAKINLRRKALDEQLSKTRKKETKDKELLTSREEERVRKAEEKHAREMAKQEDKYKKEVARLEAKRAKEAAKEQERKRKAEEKDEKVRLTRERDAARQELEVFKQERDLLRDQIGALQRENTALVAKIGRLEMGKTLLGEVQAEVAGGGRSRSSSVRRGKGESSMLGAEATILGGAEKIGKGSE